MITFTPNPIEVRVYNPPVFEPDDFTIDVTDIDGEIKLEPYNTEELNKFKYSLNEVYGYTNGDYEWINSLLNNHNISINNIYDSSYVPLLAKSPIYNALSQIKIAGENNLYTTKVNAVLDMDLSQLTAYNNVKSLFNSVALSQLKVNQNDILLKSSLPITLDIIKAESELKVSTENKILNIEKLFTEYELEVDPKLIMDLGENDVNARHAIDEGKRSEENNRLTNITKPFELLKNNDEKSFTKELFLIDKTYRYSDKKLNIKEIQDNSDNKINELSKLTKQDIKEEHDINQAEMLAEDTITQSEIDALNSLSQQKITNNKTINDNEINLDDKIRESKISLDTKLTTKENDDLTRQTNHKITIDNALSDNSVTILKDITTNEISIADDYSDKKISNNEDLADKKLTAEEEKADHTNKLKRDLAENTRAIKDSNDEAELRRLKAETDTFKTNFSKRIDSKIANTKANLEEGTRYQDLLWNEKLTNSANEKTEENLRHQEKLERDKKYADDILAKEIKFIEDMQAIIDPAERARATSETADTIDYIDKTAEANRDLLGKQIEAQLESVSATSDIDAYVREKVGVLDGLIAKAHKSKTNHFQDIIVKTGSNFPDPSGGDAPSFNPPQKIISSSFK